MPLGSSLGVGPNKFETLFTANGRGAPLRTDLALWLRAALRSLPAATTRYGAVATSAIFHCHVRLPEGTPFWCFFARTNFNFLAVGLSGKESWQESADLEARAEQGLCENAKWETGTVATWR